MDGGVALAPPPVSMDGGHAMGRYIAEGWLHKRSSNHHLHKDKFVKRWFMIENTPVGLALSYCPSPEDRTLSKDPLVRARPRSPPLLRERALGSREGRGCLISSVRQPAQARPAG